jgi:hypothetical protein
MVFSLNIFLWFPAPLTPTGNNWASEWAYWGSVKVESQ